MPLALKYYLPALLQGPIKHCFTYMDYVRLLGSLSNAPEDKETLTQVEGLLKPLQKELGEVWLSGGGGQTGQAARAPMALVRIRRQVALEKIQELDKVVENWESKDVGQCCNEFIRGTKTKNLTQHVMKNKTLSVVAEDVLFKVSPGKRLTERRVFLFDGLMVLCKPNSRRQSSLHPNHTEYRLKEKFFIRKSEIVDLVDGEVQNAFQIAPRQMQPVTLCAKSAEDKNSWMADLVMLNTRWVSFGSGVCGQLNTVSVSGRCWRGYWIAYFRILRGNIR